jgi:hypothetical protein
MKRLKKIMPLAAGIVLSLLSHAQNTGVKSDSASKAFKASMPKSYNEVITSNAVTDDGLFKVHKVDNHWFLELPDSLLGRDILIVNRIAKAAASGNKGQFGFAGDEIGEKVVAFSKGPNNKVFIKGISYYYRSSDSTENGMFRSVLNSNLQPIIAAFDIKAYSPDSSAVVIEVTDYLNGDNDLLFFDSPIKSKYTIGAYQADKSYIETVQSFPLNVEIRTIKTYQNPNTFEHSTKTFELNSSIVLLPETPMRPRYFDERVGYFSTGYYDFSTNPQGAENRQMITRWRLEPKENEVEKYLKGELVEPKKPIVFYIDPTTPQKWVLYLIQGVNDWQKAFEKAGFKNAIYALEAPLNDPEFNLYDARHNAIIYKPSVISNASGPHVHDPRSGEILETHINWYHNVMVLLHDWYMVQAGAVDPKARKMEFDDSLMGQLIRFVSSHEVGHTLGLRHNFGASSTVPVDSLRNKKWVEAHGHTPSIMDYARFNYVAQPEDSISEKGIFPRIGPYDEWAIQWGYKWLPSATDEKEKLFLNQWVIESQATSHFLWFGSEDAVENDPRCRSEDLGDNAMKAGYYGIQNLKRIVPMLKEWTKDAGEGYDNLYRMYKAVKDQYSRYLLHVASNVGGLMKTSKSQEQKGPIFQFVPKSIQREAINFFNEQLFNEPTWLTNRNIFSLTGSGAGGDEIYSMQTQLRVIFEQVLSEKTLGMAFRFQIYDSANAYAVQLLLSDLQNAIWSELVLQEPISVYRRSVQKLYAERLIQLLTPGDETENNSPLEMGYAKYNAFTDVRSLIRLHVKQLIGAINKAVAGYHDNLTKEHLVEIKEKLKDALTIESSKQTPFKNNRN